MANVNILILGSEGAIGTRLVEIVSTNISGSRIIRVGRSESIRKVSASREKILIGDLLNASFVESIFQEHRVEVVIFCAAVWNGLNQDPKVLYENVTMFSNCLSSLSASVKYFIYLSSSSVYSDNHISDKKKVNLLPGSTYGKSKLINETLLLNKAKLNNMSACIYRPFHIVSPFEKYCPGKSHITTDFVHRYIELNKEFVWSSLPNDIFIPFYWVDDLCTIISNNIFNNDFSNKIINIGPSKSFSILHLAICVSTIAKKYDLSLRDIPNIKENFQPIKNNIVSRLMEKHYIVKDRDIMEIVERFIVEKYGLVYDH